MINVIHKNPKDSVSWLMLSDQLEEQGRTRESHAIRHLVHLGAHDRAQPSTGYGVSQDVHADHRGVHVTGADNLPLLLPYDADAHEAGLIRKYRELRGSTGNLAHTREEHPDPAVFDEKHKTLHDLGTMMRTFSTPGSTRHMNGLRIHALLKKGGYAIAYPTPPLGNRDRSPGGTVKVASRRQDQMLGVTRQPKGGAVQLARPVAAQDWYGGWMTPEGVFHHNDGNVGHEATVHRVLGPHTDPYELAYSKGWAHITHNNGPEIYLATHNPPTEEQVRQTRSLGKKLGFSTLNVDVMKGAKSRAVGLARDEGQLPDGWIKPEGTYIPNKMQRNGETETHAKTAKSHGFPTVNDAHDAGWVHISHILARPSLIAAYHPTRKFTPEQLATIREFGHSTGVDDITLDGGGTSRPLRLAREVQGGYQSFAQAMATAKSPNLQAKLRAIQQLLATAEEPGKAIPLIHHHPLVGFTPSVGAALTNPQGHIEGIARYLGSWAGMITQKPAMVGFHVHEQGPDKLHVITGKSLDGLASALLNSNIRNFSVTSTAPYRAFVYDKGGRANLKGINGDVVSTSGTGHSIGHSQGSPADARKAYRSTIDSIGSGTAVPAPAPAGTQAAAPARLAREGDPAMKSVAEGYIGKPITSDTSTIPMEESRRVAEVFAGLKHDPTHPRVVAAYGALKAEVKKQYEALVAAGYKIEPTDTPKYKNSGEMIHDVRHNKHLYYDPTHATGYDGDSDHPMLEPIHPGGPPYNDLFRAVHDAFGHAAHGHEFGRIGEHRAWQDHKKMFSPLAQEALTTETHGQNSWVNAGPHSHLPVTQRPYSEQKAAVMQLKRGETAKERRMLGSIGHDHPVRQFAYGYLIGMSSASPPIHREYPGAGVVHDVGGSIARMAPGALDHLAPHIAKAFKEHRASGGVLPFHAGVSAGQNSPHRMVDNGNSTTLNYPEAGS